MKTLKLFKGAHHRRRIFLLHFTKIAPKLKFYKLKYLPLKSSEGEKEREQERERAIEQERKRERE